MPSITALLKEIASKEQEPTNTQDTVPTIQEEKAAKKQEDIVDDKLSTVAPRNDGNPSNEVSQTDVNNLVASNQNPMGERDSYEPYTSPESMSAEYSQKGFFEDSASSLMRGVGNHVVGGFGDIAQLLGAWTGMSDLYDGNPLSRQLQEWGDDIANANKSSIPEELKDPAFSVKTFMDPKFWSTYGAEFVPQLAEFIFLGKGAGSLAKKGASAAAKAAVEGGLLKGTRNLSAIGKKLATGADEAYDLAGTGKGLGKLVNEAGELGKQTAAVVETVGAGVSNNIVSGMLNAAEAYNSRKDMVGPNGENIFTRDELSDIAGQTFRNNLQWMAMDVLSWGMTYGKGSQILKNSGMYKRGAQAFKKGKILKNISKDFAGQMTPAFRKIAGVAGKGLREGFEETFQESFENWAAIRAEEEITGKKNKYGGFMDYYNHQDNESTKTIAFAMGMLGGGAAGMLSSTNKKAEMMRKLYDRTENLKTIFDAGDQEGKGWQRFHVRETISDIVLNDKEDAYKGFMDNLVSKEIVSEEERLGYDAMIDDYKTLRQQAKNLNVRSEYALFKNHSLQGYFANQIQELQGELDQNIEIVNNMDALNDSQKATKIKSMTKEFDTEASTLKMAMAQSAANKANLILGEPIEHNVDVQFVADENGKTMMSVGLDNKDYDYYVNATNEDILAPNEDKPGFFRKIAKNILGAKASFLFNKEKKAEAEGEEKVVPEEPVETTEEGEAQQTETATEEDEVPTTARGIAEAMKKNYQKAVAKEDTAVPESETLDLENLSEEEYDSIAELDNDIESNNTVAENLKKEIEAIKKRTANPDATDAQVTKDLATQKQLEGVLENVEEDTTEKQAELDSITKGKKAKAPKKSDNPYNNVTLRPSVAKSIADRIAKKLDLSKDQQAIYEEYSSIVDEQVDKLLGKVKGQSKDFQKFVNELTDKPAVKTAKKKAASSIDKVRSQFRESIANLHKASNPFGKESRETEPGPENFRAPDTRTTDPLRESLTNHIGRIKYGPSNLDKMMAINQRLGQVFPNTKKRIRAYILDDTAKQLGIKGTGYAVGSTIYVQADKWDQGKVFMHEMSHVYFNFTKDSPETKAVLASVLKNKKLTDTIEKRYPDHIIYSPNEDPSDVFRIPTGEVPTDEQMKAWNITRLPLEDQSHILEEAFVAHLQGPLSKKYNNFFAPREEFDRQGKVKKWWNSIYQGAISEGENEADNIDLIKKMEDGKIPTANDMRDYMVTRFSELVEPIGDNEIGYENRKDDFVIASNERAAQISTDLLQEQESFEKSVFEPTHDPTQSTIDELLDEDITEEGGDGVISLMEKSFASRSSKATKIVRAFTKNYNRAIRLRKVFGIDGEILFDKRDFMYTIMEAARYSPDARTFIDLLSESPRNDVKAFMKFMDTKAFGQKNVLLNSVWFTMSNYEMVSAVGTAIKKGDNGKITHVVEESLSNIESNAEQGMMSAMAKSRSHFTRNTGHRSGEAWKDFQNIVRRIENKTADENDYINAYKFIAGPNIKIMSILEYGAINVKGTYYPAVDVLKSFIENDHHRSDDPKYRQYPDPYKFGPITRALAATNRTFTQDSIVKNAKGDMVPVRITNNHMTKELGIMERILKPNANGDIISKEAFVKKFSHITSSKTYRKTVPNGFLSNYYDSIVSGNVRPTPVYYTGITDLVTNNANTYEKSTAYEQSYQDMMMFLESPTKKTYLGNMGTLGDSPRKFYFPSVAHRGMLSGGGPTIKGKQMMDGLYNIYRNIEEFPMSKTELTASIMEEVKSERAFIMSNKEQLSNYENMAGYFDERGNNLNEKGEKMVRDYVFSTFANGLYMAEVFSPNIKYADIPKRLKNSASPVMSVNRNLKFEPILFNQSEIDGGMYILERDAARWQKAGLGVFDLNHGFKFLNYSVEKTNPNFKGRTMLLKGYTSVLTDAEVAKNPALKGLKDTMERQSDKYNAWHLKKHGAEPSLNFTDGLPNSFPIAIPLSSEKGGVFNEETDTEVPSLEMLNNKEGLDFYDKISYDKKGNYLGLEGYNFGPQQVMDKKTTKVTFPVQQMNALIVQAGNLGQMDEAEEIQQLISGEMEKELDKVTKQLKDGKIKSYNDVVVNQMDKEAMDQVQRYVIEKYGIMHPRAHQIVSNQLANTLKVAGNKLRVDGTYAHQKSDFGYALPEGVEVNGSSSLQGYSENADGSNRRAEIVLPKHLNIENGGRVRAREYIVPETEVGLGVLSVLDATKGQGKGTTAAEDLNALKVFADKRAKSLNVGTGEVKKNGKVIGYYVEGDTVLATRVPSNGPSFTGVFEAVDFVTGEGNQVQVPLAFTKTIGADLDGDALFIQHKGSNANINKAIDKTAALWLSKEMSPFIKASMDTKAEGRTLKEFIKKQFPSSQSRESLPFSPASRRKAYEDSMVAKRNIGIVFNLHRISNMLAAYESSIDMPISIGDQSYGDFMDTGNDGKGRNYKSALVANLILDNLKENAADALNLNEHTVSAFSLLVNLDVPIEEVAILMNAPLVKEYVAVLDSNNSSFNGYIKKRDIMKKLANSTIKSPTGKTIKYSPTKKKAIEVLSDPSKKEFFSVENQSAIVDLLVRMDTLNSDVQSISKIMSGHNGIETNPYLLEKQIDNFKEVMSNDKDGQMLRVPVAMTSNPDIKRYLKTAETTLEHTRKINPVYRPAITKMMKSLGEKINGGQLTSNQIKKYTQSVYQFLNSRLLGSNTTAKDHFIDLTKKGSPKNIFDRLNAHLTGMKLDGNLESNMLFSQGLSMKLDGNSPYISLSRRFFDESFLKQEGNRMQQEFSKLPGDLKEDLFLYDLLSNRWDSPLSMVPVFEDQTNRMLEKYSEEDFFAKDNLGYTDTDLAELERILMAKDHIGERNNFARININPNDNSSFLKEVQKNPFTANALRNNEPVYFQVFRKGKESTKKHLVEFMGMPDQDHRGVTGDQSDKMLQWAKMMRDNLREVKVGNPENLDVDLVTINGAKKKRPVTTGSELEGMEAREEYWQYSDLKAMDRGDFDAAMEFDNIDTEAKRQALYEQYLKSKQKANDVFTEKMAGKDLQSMLPSTLLALYDKYGKENAYAFAIITTPLVRELAARISAQQSKLTERHQGNKDISPVMAFFMANNVPSDHPAAQGLVRNMEVMYKKFIQEKKTYMSEINSVTDELYKEKFGFSALSNNPWNLVKRFFHTFFTDRKLLYQTLYGNLVTRTEKVIDGKRTFDFALKSKEEIAEIKASGSLTKAEEDFYNMFKKTTKSLSPYSMSQYGLRKDYIPHVTMGAFESFSNRGILGLVQSSKDYDERIRDVKMFMKNPETGKNELWPFADIDAHYRAMSAASGNKLSTIREYMALKKKAGTYLKKGKNEDNSDIRLSSDSMESALGMGIMNRFSNSRSVSAKEMPSMDLNHALSNYVHSTLFVNGNENFAGFKSMQATLDGILAFNEKKGFGNINKYLKVNWKDAFLKNKKQVLFGKKADKVVDLITRLNLFYALGLKASYVIGNVAAGKYHNIKNGSPKEWVLGEKRFWGVDKGFNPLDAAKRFKRSQRILKNINFMDINIYDEVSVASKGRLDNFLGDIALMPMAWSEKWIQGVQMVGMLTEEEWSRFDDNGDYLPTAIPMDPARLTMLENEVKRSQGKGYQATDQRMVQQYSLGRMFMQFSRFIPTMVHDRFAKDDIDIYGNEHIGSLRALFNMVAKVHSMNPMDYIAYRKGLSDDQRKRLDSGLKGLAMSSLIGAYALDTGNEMADQAFWDANYYADYDKLAFKTIPSSVRTTKNLIDSIL